MDALHSGIAQPFHWFIHLLVAKVLRRIKQSLRLGFNGVQNAGRGIHVIANVVGSNLSMCIPHAGATP